MKLEVKFVDAFTNTIFKGNPAAVIVTDEWLSDSVMQSIATEINLSETAFSVSYNDTSYNIRWFSPIKEIDFCGHATLATAFVLFNQHANDKVKELTFTAKAVGDLTVKRQDDNYIQMSFPNLKPQKITDIPNDLIDGLSITPQDIYLNDQAYFAIYDSEDDVLNVTQTKEYLKKLAPLDVVVTAKSQKYDFVSRYFWPASGGDEDPVTGSIHAGLAPFWAEKLGKQTLLAYQASERGGKLTCAVENDRVFVSGQAVLFLEGTITI